MVLQIDMHQEDQAVHEFASKVSAKSRTFDTKIDTRVKEVLTKPGRLCRIRSKSLAFIDDEELA